MKTSIRKLIVYLLIFTYLNLVGCTSTAVISKEALYAKCDRGSVGTLTIATEKDHITIEEAICHINNDTLIVTGINKINSDSVHQTVLYKAAMDDITYIEMEEYDSGKTLGCIIGASAVALGVFLLLAANSLGESFKEGCNSFK
jgi:hypothetical protein